MIFYSISLIQIFLNNIHKIKQENTLMWEGMMKNTINYYYNLNPNRIKQLFNYYYFYVDNEVYFFVIYTRKIEDIRAIFDFNQKMLLNDIMVNEIINNTTNTILTYINQIPYILIKISININKPITLAEIHYIASNNILYSNELMRSNWALLWADKIDYLEYYQNQNSKKHPILAEGFDYFVGMAETAISYLNNIINNLKLEKTDIGVISHEMFKLDDTVYSLYDPQNIIIDHKARDIAEYIKISFFKDNYNIFEELDEYFKHNYFSFYGISLLIARIMYPSFYFELYDEVIQGSANESAILRITSRINDYESYLNDVINYFHKYYAVYEVNWIKKNKM